MSGKQFFIKKKLLPKEVKRHLILDGHVGTRYLITYLSMANWTLRGQVTWASRSSGPTCVQKGLPGISPTTDGRGRPKFGSRWMPIIGHPYTPTKWQPNNGHPTWTDLGTHYLATRYAQLGRPLLSNLDIHLCPTWAAMFVQLGSPYLSTLETHTSPHWASNPTQIGRPSPSMSGVHVRPRRVSTSVHIGSPILVCGCPKAAKIWKPIRSEWMSGSCRSWAANPRT